MRILRTGVENVTKIVNKKLPLFDVQYRLSLYTFLLEESGLYLLMHTITKEVLELIKPK